MNLTQIKRCAALGVLVRASGPVMGEAFQGQSMGETLWAILLLQLTSPGDRASVLLPYLGAAWGGGWGCGCRFLRREEMPGASGFC